MSSSDSFPPKAFIAVLPFCFTPSLIAAVACASVKDDCLDALVRSAAPSVLPILVSPFPVAPWHGVQLAVQRALASAARPEIAEATSTVMTSEMMVFIDGPLLRA